MAQWWAVRLTAVLCVRAPDVPVMVTLNVPLFATLFAVKVTVLVVVAGLVLKDVVSSTDPR